jgi:hypothetical protein
VIEGALILLAGILIGRFMPGRRRTAKPVPPPKPVCGCGHHLARHDPATNACHAQVSADKFDIRRERCTCRRYVGPEPVPEYYAPEIAG